MWQQTNEWIAMSQGEQMSERRSWARMRSRQRAAKGCVLCSLPAEGRLVAPTTTKRARLVVVLETATVR